MKTKTSRWTVRGVAILALAVAIGALAEPPAPKHFGGVINDYTPISGGTTAWEVRGPWNLNLNTESNTADFSAALTMELSVLGQSPANVSAASLTQHTHHITMKDAAVSFETVETSDCPTFKPPTSGSVLVVTGDASITANGNVITPFDPSGGTSPLTVCVSGGPNVAYANVTLQFGTPASTHFGSQAIHGIVRHAGLDGRPR
ncbi:MAG: hypothetical protein WCA98_19545 [Candidatus Acidiferrales bacterium]